ncbi:MAG: hypothetical protein WCV88_05725 [Patescibacteria group bacterium]|jgi:hypothetical protein
MFKKHQIAISEDAYQRLSRMTEDFNSETEQIIIVDTIFIACDLLVQASYKYLGHKKKKAAPKNISK